MRHVLPNRVDDHRAVDTMTILRLLAEERRSVVVRSHGEEAMRVMRDADGDAASIGQQVVNAVRNGDADRA